MLLAIFDLTDPIVNYDGIPRYEFRGYEPDAHINLSTSGEIRIHVTNKDTIVYPAGSYQFIEGRLKKADGTAYATTDKVTCK